MNKKRFDRHKYISIGIIAAVVFVMILAAVLCTSVDKAGKNDAKDFLNDYDLLWKTLEEEYVFFPYIEGNGIEIDRVRETYRKIVERNGTDVISFESTLNLMFHEMGNLGHLWVLDPQGYERYYEFYYDEFQDLLENEKVKKTYTDILPAGHGESLSADLPEVSFQYDETLKAAIVKIRSFDSRLVTRDHDVIVNDLNSLSDKPVEHVVFDITGNRGGDTTYWRNNIVSIFGGEYDWQDTIYVKDTALAKKYYLEKMQFKPISEIPESTIPGFVSELGLNYYTVFENSISGNTELNDKLCKARRWVLMDNDVYSSAESFVNFCKKTRWAATVGTISKGDGLGTAAILVMLPDSGLLVRFKLLCPENASGQLSVVSGTVPDYLSAIQETPSETLIRVIDEGSEE